MAALNTEQDPAEEFPPVVGAWDPLEAPSLGDTALSGAWSSEVSEGDVGHQVEELEQAEEDHKAEHELLAASPLWRAVLWVQEEVHVNETEDDPVVERVLEQVKDRHSIIRKSVHKQCLKFSLQVVRKN